MTKKEKKLYDAMVEQLANALNWIMCNHDDEFVDDSGHECPPHLNGDFGGFGDHVNYGEYSFSWREALDVLRDAGGDILEYRESSKNYSAFLQMFATREGAQIAMSRLNAAISEYALK